MRDRSASIATLNLCGRASCRTSLLGDTSRRRICSAGAVGLAPDFSPETIFISYSRSDGREFAEKFERRLAEEAGIRSWRDLNSMVVDDVWQEAQLRPFMRRG